MKRLCALLCMLALIFAAADMAQARSDRTTGGGSGRSHGSKSANAYIVRHCKTAACYKKHPSGTYGFVPGRRKRKN